ESRRIPYARLLPGAPGSMQSGHGRFVILLQTDERHSPCLMQATRSHFQYLVSVHRQFGALDPGRKHPEQGWRGPISCLFCRQSAQRGPVALKVLKSFDYPADDLRSKSWKEFVAPDAPAMDFVRSEERRVGQEWRSRGSACQHVKN